MSQHTITNDRKMTAVLREWASKNGCEHLLDIDDDGSLVTFRTFDDRDCKSYQIFLQVEEETDCFYTYVYASSLIVPQSRMRDMSKTLKSINACLLCGGLEFVKLPNTCIVLYKAVIESHGNSFMAEQIDDAYKKSQDIFSEYRQLLDTVAETNVSADEAWADFIDHEGQECE